MWSFHLVIYAGTSAPCKHLFISSASLSWMEVNFLNQISCIPSWPGIFWFGIFCVVLRKSICISTFGSSSNPSSSLVILFIHSAFSFCFLVAIFWSKIVRFLWHPVFGMFFCLLPLMLIEDIPKQLKKIFFHCFGISSFVFIFLPFVDTSLISLLSACAYSTRLHGQISILAQFPVYHLHKQSFLVSYSFSTSLPHLLLMWLIISSI